LIVRVQKLFRKELAAENDYLRAEKGRAALHRASAASR